jgi:RNA polymerase sigma-70 factor (ECF subfamily)
MRAFVLTLNPAARIGRAVNLMERPVRAAESGRAAKNRRTIRGVNQAPLAALDAEGQAADERQETAEVDWCDIRATLGGDGQAYARIIRRYQDQITSQMWRLSRRRPDCEQLVHDVFVEAFMSLRHFQGRAPLLHWLRKIATRVGYRYWKQQARLRRQATVALQDWHKSSPADQRLDEAEAASRVHALLAQLPPRDRLVLTLIYLEGCSVAEAAQRAGWSQTMTKVQAHRARKKLKKLLEDVPDA